MSNTSKIELSIPELGELNELVKQLIAKFGTPAAAQQAVSTAAAQIQANPTPAASSPNVAAPTPAAPAKSAGGVASIVPNPGYSAPVAPQTPAASSAHNGYPAFPFTAPAQAAPNVPQPPVAAPNAYGSTPSQAYPSNPAAAAQPTYPQQIQQPAPAPQQPPVTTGITYTVEQIANAAAPIMQRGDGQKLVELLAKYHVQALTQLDAQYLPSFAADIRALGAQI